MSSRELPRESAPRPSQGFRALRGREQGSGREGAQPHLQTAEVRASEPGLSGGCRAGPGRGLGAPVLFEALQQEVVNGGEVVVTAVLQRLGSKESGVRARPWLRWPLGFPVRSFPGKSQSAKSIHREGDKLALKLRLYPILTPQAMVCFA